MVLITELCFELRVGGCVCTHTYCLPVLAVRLQAREKVTGGGLNVDGLVLQVDDVRGDLRPITAGLLPLQEEARGGGVV